MYVGVMHVPVDAATQLLEWVHLPLGQTLHPWGWMTAAMP